MQQPREQVLYFNKVTRCIAKIDEYSVFKRFCCIFVFFPRIKNVVHFLQFYLLDQFR